MPAQTDMQLQVADGDEAFYRVDTRTPAHQLPPGTCADAVNKRFEDGRAWPRWALEQQAWGANPKGGKVCGSRRFSDPQGFDCLVVLTDDWRSGPGEDGGRGRCWRYVPGNAPMAVPLNGHDVYGTARLVPCFNALALLRQDAERHYVSAASNPVIAPGTLQLNAAPNWVSGELVGIYFDGTLATALTGGTLAPASGAQVYVKNIGNNQVTLYQDSQLNTPYNFTGLTGRLWLERQSANPGPYGNGAPPLLAQADTLGNSWAVAGFLAVPANLAVTAISSNGTTLTCPNHRLNAGDEVSYYHASLPAQTFYVVPANDHQLTLWDSQTDALLNVATGGSGGQQTAAWKLGDYLVKAGASGLPMPPAREGLYTNNNRLVLVNGASSLIISDPLDPLHYSPVSDEITANLGEADSIVAVAELAGTDTLIILKTNCVLGLYNFSQASSAWYMQTVTREFGCAAALAAGQWGNNLLFLSRRGLDRVTLSAFGLLQPAERPVSYDLKAYTDRIDWTQAGGAVLEQAQNRLLLALPLLGAAGGSGNTTALSLNLLNSASGREEWGWEGVWTWPAGVAAAGLCRLPVAGMERLALVDAGGSVNWLTEGTSDFAAGAVNRVPVSDRLRTRCYTGGQTVPPRARKVWLRLLANWDTRGPDLTVAVIAPGANDQQMVAQNFGYDKTQYLAGVGAGAYAPGAGQFNAPHRADYSVTPAELVGGGGGPDVKQNVSQPFRFRLDTWGVQVDIVNTAGECRLGGVRVHGVLGPSSDRLRV